MFFGNAAHTHTHTPTQRQTGPTYKSPYFYVNATAGAMSVYGNEGNVRFPLVGKYGFQQKRCINLRT